MANSAIEDLKGQTEELKAIFVKAMAESRAQQDSMRSSIEFLVSTISDLKKQLGKEYVGESIPSSPPAGEAVSRSDSSDSKTKKSRGMISVGSDSDCSQDRVYLFPDDYALIDNLVAKILDQPYVFCHRYKTLDFYDYHPQELAELYEPDLVGLWYFLVKKDNSRICDSVKMGIHRKAKNGYWKGDYADEIIKVDGYNAKKKWFVFHEQNRDQNIGDWGESTYWVMREYRIDDVPELDSWTLCRMYLDSPCM